MAQHDYDIANADGATVRADINSLAEAIATLNSGASAPSTTFANMLWWDSSNNVLKKRNSANTGWVELKAPTQQVFTSSGTWIKPTGCTKVKVTVVGGGGGGGGVSAVANDRSGGGGGGGGTSIKIIDVTATAATETVTIGAGGSASAGSAGGNGGSSSFGAHCSATGGNGGGLGGSGANTGGSGGSGASGDINISGDTGGQGSAVGGSFIGGPGGASIYGGTAHATQNDAGTAAVIYGAGGSGAAEPSSDSTARSGGAGKAGIVIVEEFYDGAE